MTRYLVTVGGRWIFSGRTGYDDMATDWGDKGVTVEAENARDAIEVAGIEYVVPEELVFLSECSGEIIDDSCRVDVLYGPGEGVVDWDTTYGITITARPDEEPDAPGPKQ